MIASVSRARDAEISGAADSPWKSKHNFEAHGRKELLLNKPAHVTETQLCRKNGVRMFRREQKPLRLYYSAFVEHHAMFLFVVISCQGTALTNVGPGER